MIISQQHLWTVRGLAWAAILWVFAGAFILADSTDYGLAKDISYRDGAEDGAEVFDRCRLDVYYPKSANDFATVIWFHSGGLKRGSRYVPTQLKEQGLGVVAVNYRLSPNVAAPAYIEDAAAATAWVFKHIKEYGGSQNQIFVCGASAGGYLTTMVGLDKSYLDKHGVDANRIAGLVSLSGQAITHVAVRQEAGIGRKHPVIDTLAPLYHVRADAPPILLVTGDRELELLGRYEENAYFWRMLKLVGHPDVELHEIPGKDHPALERAALPLLLDFVKRRSGEQESLIPERRTLYQESGLTGEAK